MELNLKTNTRKVPVVYYLCRNRHLEHPHFIEVELVSPNGLYLRDVIEKFDVLRGRGMSSMYSWSCKRSYKNAYVWNDLCKDDLIVPANENEYVLKGSELITEHNPGCFVPARSKKMQSLEHIALDDCSSLANMSSSDVSPESNGRKSVTKYKIYKSSHGLADASTQTDEYVKVKKSQKTRMRNLSSDICDVRSDPSTSSSSCLSAGKTDTLESLLKADVSKPNSTENVEEKELEDGVLTNRKLKASSMFLQLFSCGSISSQDNVDYLADSIRFTCRKLEDKEYFSGSLVEAKSVKKENISSLKRSSSYTANRTDKNDSTLTRSKCVPRSIMASLSKQPKSASMRYSVFEGPRISFEGGFNSCILSPCPSNSGSKRFTAAKTESKRKESFSDNKENVMKTEESFLQELGSSSSWKEHLVIATLYRESGNDYPILAPVFM